MTKRLGLDFLEAKFEALSRELSLGGAGGTQLIGHRHVVETITASDSLTAADSGKVFLLDAADETDVQVQIHTDTLNESGFFEDTMQAINGRTIHTYHSEGAGGGHAPAIIAVSG